VRQFRAACKKVVDQAADALEAAPEADSGHVTINPERPRAGGGSSGAGTSSTCAGPSSAGAGASASVRVENPVGPKDLGQKKRRRQPNKG